MKGKLLILALLGGLLFAQCSPNKLRKRSVVKVALLVDSSAMIRQSGFVPAGFSIRLNNGKTKATTGLANGMWGWGRFIVKAENANFVDGNLVYDPADVLANNKKIKLVVKPRNNANYTDTFTVDIPRPVQVSLNYNHQSVLAPEQPIEMMLRVMYDNGQVVSSTKGDGSFLWDLFDLEYDGKTDKRNTIWVENKAPTLVDSVHVGIRYKYNDTITAKTSVPLDYKASYAFDYSGVNGERGWNGNDGYSYNYECSNNRNGKSGNSGSLGENGQNGQNVVMYIDIVYRDAATFLLIKLVSNLETKTIYLNMDGGKIVINCKGGNGGNGGNGGQGGDGGSETKNSDAGKGGNGGAGGRGGNGGNGGIVTIYASKEAKPYLGLIQIDNSGGVAGIGGKGGKKGRGGSKEKTTFLELLLGTNNGYRGSDGYRGNKGTDGPPMQLFILSSDEIQRRIEMK